MLNLWKKAYVVLLAVWISLLPMTVFADEQQESEPQVSAGSAILICADTGDALFAKNENERRPMASTTKIMTALLAFEEADSNNKEVEITDAMVRVEGSSMGLLPGNVLTLENIAKGMMMCSGNDAANSLAIAISGSTEKFSDLMNERAEQIGMTNTHFVTPSGLGAKEHYSTAKDMAALGAYAMENKKFCQTVSSKSICVPFCKPEETHTYKNHNRLLSLYNGCIGVKTGFTKEAGRCLVSCAERNGVRLVAVTLNAPDDWKDHQAMYDYGFSKVSSMSFDDSSVRIPLKVVGGIEDEIYVLGKTSSKITVRNEDINLIQRGIELPSSCYAPIHKGQIVGKVVYRLDGKIIASNDLTADRDLDYKVPPKNIFQKIGKFFGNLFG